MAVRRILSDPKPSQKIQGWLYAYYSKPTRDGGDGVVVFSPALRDIVKRGFTFVDELVSFDEALGASVLQLDFDEPAQEDGPAFPADPESGWGDPDSLLAAAPASNDNGHAPYQGGQARTVRKRQGEAIASMGAQLPADFLQINLQVSRSFLLQLSLIGDRVSEARRADVAQKLCAIASIPYYRQKGVELGDDDIKGMTSI